MIHLALFARDFNVFNFSYQTRQGSIESHAAALVSYIKQRATTDDEIYFISHSLGSLVIGHALPELVDFNLQRAVFLGPPLKGSIVAQKLLQVPFIRRYFGEPFAQLAARQPLDIAPAVQERILIGVIAGVLSKRWSLSPWFSEPNDFLVAVDETKVDGIQSHLELHCPHAVLMYAPHVLRATFNYLRHGRFNTL
jgi:hypothetical protein